MTIMDRRLGRRSVALGLGAGAFGLMSGLPSLARGIAATDDEALLAPVNPELRQAARSMLAWRNGPPLSEHYKAIREQTESTFPAPLPGVPVSTQRIAVRGVASPVTAYVINAGAGHRPAILHTHGGGFVLGSAKSEIPAKQAMARDLGCVIVTVDYSLAPEATYKLSVAQNYAALRWLYHHASELGVDPRRIAVMGESAGGGHAALLAIAARDRGEVPLAFQCLVYPMLDDRTGSSRIPPKPIGELSWDAPSNRFGWQSFLGQAPGGTTVPVEAVPARTRSLAGLPPAFIGVGSIDLFVDEDMAYAKRLIDASIATDLHVVPGAFHGFDGAAPDSSVAQQFTSAKMNALRRAFAFSRAAS